MRAMHERIADLDVHKAIIVAKTAHIKIVPGRRTDVTLIADMVIYHMLEDGFRVERQIITKAA